MAQLIKNFVCSLLVLSLHLCCSLEVMAQDLADPTRPPASILHPGLAEAQSAGPVLQSILISANRKIAIIDGQTIRLNGKFGDQTLIRIGESEVTLKRGKQLQTLSLHPDLRKKPSR
jgi:MSHA biogenesis protein MshK